MIMVGVVEKEVNHLILRNRGSDICLNTPRRPVRLPLHPGGKLNGARFDIFEDPRLYQPKRTLELEKFLPRGYELIAGPLKGQNCFGYCMGKREIVSATDFSRWLREESGREKVEEDLMEGDLIVYHRGQNPEVASFAALVDQYKSVISRIGCCNGFGGPLVRFSIENLPAELYDFKRVSWYSKWRE